MNLKHDLYVISLTHWDREWRFPFQKTRAMLVDMMDGLLKLLETRPEYKCFHLDGQTILLEDYCEVRPENKERIRKLVQAGRVLIGPWYTLPEENQLSGESLVRNFLYGYKVGKEFGGVMDCGYSPTSWGQVSQIPQIMRGFGIKSAIFYRGISGDQVPGHFYNWKSPDGTSIFGVRLGDFARSSFFHLVCRPVIYNRFYGDSIHKWERGGKPLRLSGTGTTTPYQFCNPPMGWHPENIEKAVEQLYSRDLTDWNDLSFAISMECNDTTGPFPETPRIIEAVNKLAGGGPGKLIHGKLTDFIARAMKEVDPASLPALEGEFRNTLRAGVWTDLYPEVQAARMPLKYMNRQSEYRLQKYAEPFAALAWALGAQYPTPILEKAWKWLLANHAHDSIGGCSMDAVHYENEFRYNQANILSDNVLLDSLLAITGRVDTSSLSPSDQVLYVFNNLPYPRSGVVEAEIDYEVEKKLAGVEVADLAGKPRAVQELDKTELLVIFQHPCELPCRMRCHRRKIAVDAGEIPAFGYKVFRVRPAKKVAPAASIVTGPATLENEHLKVAINANGTFDVTAKADGASYRGLNYFHDQGEVGDPWIGAFPQQDKIVTSLDGQAELETVESGPNTGAIRVTVQMSLPVGCSPDRKKRLAKTRAVKISSVVRLRKGEKFVRIETTIENTVKDHILRAFFPTGLQAAGAVQVEMPYDVVQRDIKHPDTAGWREPYRPVQPQRSFVDLTDGKRGFALLNAGNGQYEAVDSPQRELALTLLRCHRQWNSVRLAEYPDQPGSQLEGRWTFEYAVYPHAGDWQAASVALQSMLFNLPLKAAVGGPGQGALPAEKSFIQVEDSRIELGAVKKCEWDDALVLRLINPGRAAVSTGIRFGLPVKSAELVDMKEEARLAELPCRDGRVGLDVPAGKILTLKVTLGK